MAKNPGKGRCVHCLKEGVERNWDHVLPKSWYPDTTAADMEKWQIPSCVACNDRYGKLERDLIGRLGLTLDANNPASAGLAEKALRAINPDAAKNEGDAAARNDRAKKILGEMYKGDELKGKNVVPGLGEGWDRPLEEQLGISIPEESLPAMTEKIVRGITLREDGAFIEPDQKIQSFLVKDGDVNVVKEMLDRAGKVFKREPGLVVRRARSKGGDLYEITFWDQLKMYATVSKRKPAPALSPRQRRALRRARLNAWLQQRAGKQGRPKAKARRGARKRARQKLMVG
ncbi:hypothetical protein IVA95_04325 [Bradyrhizobium sp. 157]|uniref:HNH endonuclease n=1 Tax=Bradyrhizobium sp. 157 TaxID=2782631 RepID=UPI001FFA73EA|nr:hypothetical protein [Bradyrhizobium sp. 157]MCK1636831.1 hypothetical protein [Bradyrhizobium sp. 157]